MQDSLQDALCKIGYNWPIDFEEKRYLEIVNVFSPYILTNSKGVRPVLDSCFFPLLKDALC